MFILDTPGIDIHCTYCMLNVLTGVMTPSIPSAEVAMKLALVGLLHLYAMHGV